HAGPRDDAVTIGLHTKVAEAEVRVGEGVAEGEQRLLAELVVPAIADEDAFVVALLAVDAGVALGPRRRRRPLRVGGREGDRQPAAGIAVAEQHRGERGPELLARVP